MVVFECTCGFACGTDKAFEKHISRMGSQLGHKLIERDEPPPKVDADEEDYDEEAEEEARWANQDFYSVLQLTPSATSAEIKKNFRKVALTCHPDKVVPEDKMVATRHFQTIAEAYEVLSNEDKRKRFDRVRPKQGHSVAVPKFRSSTSTPQPPQAVSQPCAPSESQKPYSLYQMCMALAEQDRVSADSSRPEADVPHVVVSKSPAPRVSAEPPQQCAPVESPNPSAQHAPRTLAESSQSCAPAKSFKPSAPHAPAESQGSCAPTESFKPPSSKSFSSGSTEHLEPHVQALPEEFQSQAQPQSPKASTSKLSAYPKLESVGRPKHDVFLGSFLGMSRLIRHQAEIVAYPELESVARPKYDCSASRKASSSAYPELDQPKRGYSWARTPEDFGIKKTAGGVDNAPDNKRPASQAPSSPIIRLESINMRSCEGCFSQCLAKAMKRCSHDCNRLICSRCAQCQGCNQGSETGNRCSKPAKENDAENDANQANIDNNGTLGILLAMGFDREKACMAAARCSSVRFAVELLVMGESRSRQKHGQTKKVREMREGLRSNLLELGFSKTDATEACARCSSIEAAVELLTSPEKPLTWRGKTSSNFWIDALPCISCRS